MLSEYYNTPADEHYVSNSTANLVDVSMADVDIENQSNFKLMDAQIDPLHEQTPSITDSAMTPFFVSATLADSTCEAIAMDTFDATPAPLEKPDTIANVITTDPLTAATEPGLDQNTQTPREASPMVQLKPE